MIYIIGTKFELYMVNILNIQKNNKIYIKLDLNITKELITIKSVFSLLCKVNYENEN